MARPNKQFMIDLDRYSKISEDDLGALSTSEILSFFSLASLLDPEDLDAIVLADSAHANLGAEIDRRFPPRI